MFRILLFSLLFCTAITVSAEAASGPKDYDECILKHMSGAGNDSAVAAIKQACRNKFPPNEQVKAETAPALSCGKYLALGEKLKAGVFAYKYKPSDAQWELISKAIGERISSDEFFFDEKLVYTVGWLEKNEPMYWKQMTEQYTRKKCFEWVYSDFNKVAYGAVDYVLEQRYNPPAEPGLHMMEWLERRP